VHTGGKVATKDTGTKAEAKAGGGPTFKCSRDNCSAEFRITDISGETVTVASLGRDERTGLEVGDWVELVDDAWAPHGQPTPLLAVRGIDRGRLVVTLSGPVTTESQHPYLRRWDLTADNADGIPIVESSGSTWLDLEDGVQIRFAPKSAEYQRGDYWLIPARIATGGVLWPGDGSPDAVPPHGPARYLVPLALVGDSDDTKPVDLRTLFIHLACLDEGDSDGAGAP
jgi:hypothetical protein